jgi:hypothetical protein
MGELEGHDNRNNAKWEDKEDCENDKGYHLREL